jgi:hypothetical protein
MCVCGYVRGSENLKTTTEVPGTNVIRSGLGAASAHSREVSSADEQRGSPNCRENCVSRTIYWNILQLIFVPCLLVSSDNLRILRAEKKDLQGMRSWSWHGTHSFHCIPVSFKVIEFGNCVLHELWVMADDIKRVFAIWTFYTCLQQWHSVNRLARLDWTTGWTTTFHIYVLLTKYE